MRTVPMSADEPLWGYDQVAEHINVPARTVRRWVAAGKGPRALRLGRRVRFRPADVESWLSTRYADAA